MPGSQCAPVSIAPSRHGVSHGDRGDLQRLHRSLHVANTKDTAQPCHCPMDSPGGGWPGPSHLRK